MLAVLGAVVWGGLTAWRRVRQWLPPTIPDDWRALGAQDPVLADALDLWDRLGRLSRDAAPQQRLALLRGVHGCLADLVALVRVRVDLRDYLARAGAADEPALQARAEGLAGAAEAARDELRGVYAELLAAFEHDTDGGEAAVRRTQGVLADLRHQAAAEQELRAWLTERAG